LVKPDPAIYRLALDRFGLEAAETVFIDDNAANIAGAQSVGLIGLHFTGEPTLRRELETLGLL
ncbi:HAD-IA family hydrolase, partial [Clostridium perfringens]